MYDWADKKDECYRLYVQEGKSLDEVMAHFREKGFEPSQRAFQANFTRWGFKKQNPAYENEALVARCRELWEKNATQSGMLETLQSEGFKINHRELVRLRWKLNMMLRTRKRKRTPTETDSEDDEDEDAREMPSESGIGPAPVDDADGSEGVVRGTMLHRQVEETIQSVFGKERPRRKISRLPPNAPLGPPRYPSETTIDESKAYLSLDNDLYAEVREQFKTICEEEGVTRKSTAGPEKWGQVKGRLVRENMHLSFVFQQDPDATAQIGVSPTPTNSKALSLDVICMDVAKRLRQQGTSLTLAEARNALGLNPQEARDARSAFLTILKANNFTSVYENGAEFLNSLKRKWIRGSALSRALSDDDDDATRSRKMKAIEVLKKDAMKRHRCDLYQEDPSLKKQLNTGIGPGPAPKRPKKKTGPPASGETVSSGNTASQRTQNSEQALGNTSPDFEIDPSLILAATNPSMLPETQQYNLQPLRGQFNHPAYSQPQQQPYSLPLPIYFRLHPHSQRTAAGKSIWLSIFQSGTINELRGIAKREHPGTMLVRLEGVMVHKVPGSQDSEVTVPIDEQEELEAYLRHVVGEGGSGKATFVVWLGVV